MGAEEGERGREGRQEGAFGWTMGLWGLGQNGGARGLYNGEGGRREVGKWGGGHRGGVGEREEGSKVKQDEGSAATSSNLSRSRTQMCGEICERRGMSLALLLAWAASPAVVAAAVEVLPLRSAFWMGLTTQSAGWEGAGTA